MKTSTDIVRVAQACALAIRDLGTDGMPAGHLFAFLQCQGYSFSQYNAIEGTLVASGLITRTGDILRWNEARMAEARKSGK